MPTNSIYDFLNDRRIQLPLDWSDWNGCYLSYIEDLFNHYKRLIAEFNREDELLCEIDRSNGTISELCNGIIDTIQLYIYKGKEDAYEKFKNLLNQQNINTCLNELFSSEVDPNHDSLKNLYKVRKFPDDEDINAVLEKTTLEMFHVPQCINRPLGRYDYGEFPCLYLGGSIPFCIKETIDYTKSHFPPNILWVKYKIIEQRQIRVLDFAWKLGDLIGINELRRKAVTFERKDKYTKFLKVRLIMWPLVAACSTRVRAINYCCKPEYIIPHQLIRYIYENNNQIDGIRYFSTKYIKNSERKCKVESRCDYARENINFVFPAKLKDHKEKYSSALAQKFEISKSYQVNDRDIKQWKLLEDDCDGIQDYIHREEDGFTPVRALLEKWMKENSH